MQTLYVDVQDIQYLRAVKRIMVAYSGGVGEDTTPRLTHQPRCVLPAPDCVILGS